ncbi:hypothetical protein POG14_04680 [Clostridium paraputrificum]|uniref:hypothetical protein n=1 Tax=Clostridium paraputrificum TaxID=29363 RepID=UPI000C073D15|nr:hypothetical protein [Clostridium paraputrificum]MDC0801470.1 hypothetical protein [Clostridium paraputrificum]
MCKEVLKMEELEEWVEEGFAGFIVSGENSQEKMYVDHESFFNIIPSNNIEEVSFLDEYKEDIIVNLLNGTNYTVARM